MSYAVMRITKRGTRSLIGETWVNDYIIDTAYTYPTQEEAISEAIKEGSLTYVAPFDENRWNLPPHIWKRINQLGLHVIL